MLTSGGDAPGMNAAIRAVVRTAINKGIKVKGIMRGYAGLLQEEIVDMESTSVSEIINRGGTCLLYTSKQIEDIVYIRDTIGFEGLPENLEEIAKARLERPEATLKELGEGLDPPVGKSGVNHRLRKLSILAADLKEKRSEQ